MSILVIAEQLNGKITKFGREAVTYAHKTGGGCTALLLGEAKKPNSLGKYGADKVIHIAEKKLNTLDTPVHLEVIKQVVEELSPSLIVLSHSSYGKSLCGGLSVVLTAGLVTAATTLAEKTDGHWQVRKSVFSGKAFADIQIITERGIITVMGNSFSPEVVGDPCEVESMDVQIPERKVKVVEQKTASAEKAPLPEAERVVSGGRGMKGPDNWHLLEELAEQLDATLACSRPVADTGWRPHHEHVGQTGIAIRPQLYVAVGISGAIQHLAGVNNSKTIVVINKDPEAPFFKAADYGVVGDLFDVVPRLIEALKNFHANRS